MTRPTFDPYMPRTLWLTVCNTIADSNSDILMANGPLWP